MRKKERMYIMKKFVSMVMALVMVMALAVPAFADPLDATTIKDGAETTLTGTTKAPTISVTVPATATFTFNPYQMTVQDGDGNDVQDQFVSANQAVVNNSDVAINVSATVTADVGGEAKLAAKSAAKATDNSVYVFAKFAASTAEADDFKWTDKGVKATQIVAVADNAKETSLGTLAAKTNDATTSLYYTISGDAAQTPETAWATTDTVSVTIAFTFAPSANAVAKK